MTFVEVRLVLGLILKESTRCLQWRVAAAIQLFVLRAHRLSDVDGELAFGAGLSTPGVPVQQLAQTRRSTGLAQVMMMEAHVTMTVGMSTSPSRSGL